MTIVSERTLKAMTAYSAGKMKPTQITQNIVDPCLSQMQCEKLVIVEPKFLIRFYVAENVLDIKYIRTISLFLNIGQGYSYRSLGSQIMHSGGRVGGAYENMAGADYGIG